MIRTERLGYFDNAGCWHLVDQLWARIPATGVWMVVSAQEVDVDPAEVPACPTRPV